MSSATPLLCEGEGAAPERRHRGNHLAAHGGECQLSPYGRGLHPQALAPAQSPTQYSFAKCSRDLDLLAWYLSGVPAVRVSSFGSLKQFRPRTRPQDRPSAAWMGARLRRLAPYSARANYITQGLWGAYAWEPIEHLMPATEEQKLESLRTDNPFGRCVWHCDNDVVDHQSVLVEFANGVTASTISAPPQGRPNAAYHRLQGASWRAIWRQAG